MLEDQREVTINLIRVKNHYVLYVLLFKNEDNLYAQISELSKSRGNVLQAALRVHKAVGKAGFSLRVNTGFRPNRYLRAAPPVPAAGPPRGDLFPREVWELSVHLAI